jgi:hypothetical protein
VGLGNRQLETDHQRPKADGQVFVEVSINLFVRFLQKWVTKRCMSIAANKISSVKTNSVLATTFFTAGYEQSEPEIFLRRPQNHGVEIIVQMRDMPLSRKRCFSKNQLQALFRFNLCAHSNG